MAMEVEFELTKDDLVESHLYYLKNSPLAKKQTRNVRILAASFGVVLTVIGFISLGIVYDYFGLVFIAFGVTCIVGLVQSYIPGSVRKRALKTLENFHNITPNPELCLHNISISNEGIIDISDFGESKEFWKGFREIKQSGNYLYFYSLVGNKGYVFPKRAFPDEASFTQFSQSARDFHAKALAEKS